MTPIVRWTIGPVSGEGLKVLKESVRWFSGLYPDVQKVICYNNLDKRLLKFGDDVRLFKASKTSDIEYEPKNEMWKLYPPRLEVGVHELVLDNDLIITNRFDELDDFFNGDHTILLHGRNRFYGKYDHLVPQGCLINGGLFGMPPGFDFADKINHICQYDEDRCWKNRSDDQGVIAAALLDCRGCCVIPNSVVLNYDPFFDKGLPHEMMARKSGVHFIGINRSKHPGWEYYKTLLLL